MTRGRQSKTLDKRQIDRLREFQHAKRYSVPQLKLAMEAPFKWGVLQRALRGEPIWILNHTFIADWIDRSLSKLQSPLFDAKRAAAGDREENSEPPVHAGRLRSADRSEA